MDARFHVPFGAIVSGPPMSGKSTFVMKLLSNADRYFDKHIDYVYWFYGEKNRTVSEIEKNMSHIIKTVEGLPENINEYIHEGANG